MSIERKSSELLSITGAFLLVASLLFDGIFLPILVGMRRPWEPWAPIIQLMLLSLIPLLVGGLAALSGYREIEGHDAAPNAQARS
jgi:hypothetical protein